MLIGPMLGGLGLRGWGGGCEDNMPLNSLATVIRPSGLTHMHPHTSTHGAGTGGKASFFFFFCY